MNKMRPVRPGAVLREQFLAPIGLSANALALELKVPAPRISEIVRERRAITPDTALRLSRYSGTSPEFWMDRLRPENDGAGRWGGHRANRPTRGLIRRPVSG